MREFPNLDHKGGNLEISWHTPDHLGGPISRFEVMVKQNGQDANETYVKYVEGKLLTHYHGRHSFINSGAISLHPIFWLLCFFGNTQTTK